MLMLTLKHGLSRPVMLFTAMLLSVVFAVHSKTHQQSENFLTETKQGKVVLAYLRCTDFDCVEALDAVVKLGPDVVPALVELLKSQPPQMIVPDLPKDKLALLVRTRVINALGELKDKRAVEVLLKTVEDKLPQVRAAATEALGKIETDRAFTAVVLRLQDGDPFVRETAAKTLGRLQRPESLDALNTAARKEPVPHVREAMEAAIRSIQQRHP
jgi:hypothetical protein